MVNAVVTFGCILLAWAFWLQAKQATRKEILQRTRAFFGKVVLVKNKTSYWQRYIDQLQTELNRIYINVQVAKYARYVPITMVAFILITHFVFGVSAILTLTMAILLLLLPRKIVAELSARHVIRIRKRLIIDVITPGIHTLNTGNLHAATEEIQHDPSTSELIRREFEYINDLGRAPGDMDVAKAMTIRAKELGISEFTTLSILTMEGQRYNARLTEVWRDIHHALSDKVRTHTAIAAELSAYRWAAIGLFLFVIVFVIFGYRAMHIHGAMQFGIMITLISYFAGISQMTKATQID